MEPGYNFGDGPLGVTNEFRIPLPEFFAYFRDIGHWWAKNLPIYLHELWQKALNWLPVRDPLALDLDGDGIETIAANGAVLFDHDGDEVRTATGWVKGDDGMLVLDRNGNGVIDDGSELFGDQTPGAALQPGETTNRSAGLRALSRLDTNADGKFDVQDTQFGDVRVWRDLNQDGVSQSSELFTLTELGIAAINLNPTSTTDVNLGNGNSIDSTGSYVRTDGSLGTLGDLLLGSNTFQRQFENRIPLTDLARSLPNLRGSGMVRDLNEAASLDNDLANAIAGLTPGMSRDQMMARMDDILKMWADTSKMQTIEALAA